MERWQKQFSNVFDVRVYNKNHPGSIVARDDSFILTAYGNLLVRDYRENKFFLRISVN